MYQPENDVDGASDAMMTAGYSGKPLLQKLCLKFVHRMRDRKR